MRRRRMRTVAIRIQLETTNADARDHFRSVASSFLHVFHIIFRNAIPLSRISILSRDRGVTLALLFQEKIILLFEVNTFLFKILL